MPACGTINGPNLSKQTCENLEEEEQQAVRTLLMAQFALSPDDITAVTERAEEQVDAATCLFEFTRTLNALASSEQKRALLGMMWRVAMADALITTSEGCENRKLFFPSACLLGCLGSWLADLCTVHTVKLLALVYSTLAGPHSHCSFFQSHPQQSTC